MMRKFMSPNWYIQGNGALNEIGEYAKQVGKKSFVMGGNTALSVAYEALASSFQKAGVAITGKEIFKGECTKQSIEDYAEKVKQQEADTVVAVGGGKVLDAAKGVAHLSGAEVIIVPTIVSNDAPTSGFSVIHTEKGAFEARWMYPKNPYMVLIDSSIIANSPVRTLVSGMGDALATYYEARTCYENHQAMNHRKGRPPEVAFQIATLCKDLLYQYGHEAKLAVENNIVTWPLEKVIEANVLLSGLGFESGGISGAHGVIEGLSILKQESTKKIDVLHGEEVAFGILVLLAMEGRPLEEFQKVCTFNYQMGLPTTLEELGYHDYTDETLYKGANYAMENSIMHHLNMEVTSDAIYHGIKAANALSKDILSQNKI